MYDFDKIANSTHIVPFSDNYRITNFDKNSSTHTISMRLDINSDIEELEQTGT